MQDLKDMTNDNHYENYRCEKLAAMTVGSPTNQPSSKWVIADSIRRREKRSSLKLNTIKGGVQKDFDFAIVC